MRRSSRIGQDARYQSGRRLRLESLEPRTFLAADGCEFAAEPLQPLQPLAIESVTAQAGIVSAADAAGDTFATAADLGTINGTVEREGSLSWFDRADVIRFSVTADSSVRIRLDQLSRDADLYVLDRSGKLIGSSKQTGTQRETLVGSLRRGEYFIGIAAASSRNTRYRLSVTVQPILQTSPLPVPPTKVPTTPPVAPPPVAATPQPTRPLNEVAYFGSDRDWNVNVVAAPESWAAGYLGQGVTVAVIDTGVDLDHPDLRGSLYVNPGEIAGNGIDDDHNGYIDDRTGYDFVSADAFPDDGNGHGTHVAGIIAAANNGIGSTGIAPSAKILPIRVLDDVGSGSDLSVASGIRYAADLGAQIINLSLGGGFSARIADAIRYATTLGSLVIAAAGNESADSPSNPAVQSALSSGILSVGAFDSTGRVASFSNQVGNSGAVQIDAPGVGIYSTYLDGGYRMLSGTSMASPHVAGVAALLLSANLRLTAAELRGLLTSGSVDRANGSDSIGNVSALRAVALAAATVAGSSGSVMAAAFHSSAAGTTIHATETRALTTFASNHHTSHHTSADRDHPADVSQGIIGENVPSDLATLKRFGRETNSDSDSLYAETKPVETTLATSRSSIHSPDDWFDTLCSEAWCWHDDLAFG